MLPTKKQRITFNDLQMYVAIGVKHLRLVILVTCFGLLCGLLYYEYAVPVYYSRTLIEFDNNLVKGTIDDYFRDSDARALRRRMRADHVIERGASKLGMDMRAKYFLRHHVKKMEFEMNSVGGLEVETWGTSYDLVRDWVPTLLDAYLEIRDEGRLRSHEKRIQTYSKEIISMGEKADEFSDKQRRLSEELKIAETRREWGKLKGVPNELTQTEDRIERIEALKRRLSDDSLSIVARLAFLSQLQSKADLSVGDVLTLDPNSSPLAGTPELDEADALVPVADGGGRQAAVGTDAAGGTSIVILPSTIRSRPSYRWEAVDRRRKVVASEYEELLKTYLPGHRSARAKEAELETLERALNNELSDAMARLELEHQGLLMKKRDLTAKLPLHREVSRELTQITREMNYFNQSRMNWERAATEMSKELAKLDYVSDRSNRDIRFAGIVQLNDKPVSPPRAKLAIASLGLGLAMALGLVVLIEYLDNTVTVQEQVQDELGLSGLGVIPKFGTNANPRIPLSGEAVGRHFSLVETFRVVRTNLLTNKEGDKHRQVIMVTSSIPREGKSMVASNLAATFAGLHEKTLIIDADIRRGKLHRTIGESASPGLSDVLQGNAKLADALRPTGIDNLTALPCGERVHNVPAVLISREFEEMLTELRKEYTRIIVDTPPVLGLSETCGVLPYVDGVVMVVWCGYTPLSQVRTAVENLRNNGAKFYGCILNRLDLNDAVNYQHYYYYSNYYYQSYRPDELPDELEAALRESAEKQAEES